MAEENNKERSPLFNTEGFFIGKELAGQSLEEAEKQWKRYKVKFKPKLDSEKSFSFSAFSPLKAKRTLQLEDLKEGIQYKICYSERDAVSGAGQPFVGKTIVGVYLPSVKVVGSAPKQSAKLDLSKFDAFKGR